MQTAYRTTRDVKTNKHANWFPIRPQISIPNDDSIIINSPIGFTEPKRRNTKVSRTNLTLGYRIDDGPGTDVPFPCQVTWISENPQEFSSRRVPARSRPSALKGSYCWLPAKNSANCSTMDAPHNTLWRVLRESPCTISIAFFDSAQYPSISWGPHRSSVSVSFRFLQAWWRCSFPLAMM